MKTKKSLVKNLLVLFLCFVILMPMLSVTKQYVESDNCFVIPYSDYPDKLIEN